MLNWNRCDDTLECLASLQKSTYQPLRIIVVDQNSSDESVKRIRSAHPDVCLIELQSNVGFARGVNIGIAQALSDNAQFFFLLNNDTVVDADAITCLMAELKPGVGAVGPAIFYYHQPTRIWSIGGGIHPMRLEMTGNHGVGDVLPESPIKQMFISGCALLLPRATIDKVGLLDERFFMYYEDLDYSLRIGQSGLMLLLAPRAHILHKVSVSSGGSESTQERYLMAKSGALYFRKHMTWRNAPLILTYRAGSALRWTWRLSLRGKWSALSAYWRGLAAGWLN